MRKLKPVTPSELLLEEFLKPMGISQYRLAKEIGVPAQRIGDIVAGKRAITADTDLRLCRFFGLSNGYWLRAQVMHDTETGAILIAAVTGGTDTYLHRASRATVESIRFLACPHAPHAQRWTRLRATGIKARQPRPMRARNGRPGVLPRIRPGLRLSGVCAENTALFDVR